MEGRERRPPRRLPSGVTRAAPFLTASLRSTDGVAPEARVPARKEAAELLPLVWGAPTPSHRRAGARLGGSGSELQIPRPGDRIDRLPRGRNYAGPQRGWPGDALAVWPGRAAALAEVGDTASV